MERILVDICGDVVLGIVVAGGVGPGACKAAREYGSAVDKLEISGCTAVIVFEPSAILGNEGKTVSGRYVYKKECRNECNDR